MSQPLIRLAVVMLSLAGPLGITVSTPVFSEVRFGRNARVGGHDFSNQTFSRNRRAVIHLYDRQPGRSGCVWRADGRGGKVKICHLRRIR